MYFSTFGFNWTGLKKVREIKQTSISLKASNHCKKVRKVNTTLAVFIHSDHHNLNMTLSKCIIILSSVNQYMTTNLDHTLHTDNRLKYKLTKWLMKLGENASTFITVRAWQLQQKVLCWIQRLVKCWAWDANQRTRRMFFQEAVYLHTWHPLTINKMLQWGGHILLRTLLTSWHRNVYIQMIQTTDWMYWINGLPFQ